MKMTKKRVAELKGEQLDWAVAKALGLYPIPCQPIQYFYWNLRGYDESGAFAPSSEWEHGGPIIEREEINVFAPDLEAVDHDRLWSADRHEDQRICYGPTPLIAAMRAFVASKLGDEVEVPE